MAAPYVKPTGQHNTAARNTAGSRVYRITDTAIENLANVVYTSREFNLSKRLFEDSPEFREPQRIFVRSA